jgi:hypothetical protein
MHVFKRFRWLIPLLVLALVATTLSVAADTATLQRLGFSISDIHYVGTAPSVAVSGQAMGADGAWVAFANRRIGSPFQDIVVRTFDATTGQWTMRGNRSLNYETSTTPTNPHIEFAGQVQNGRGTVPWVTWSENVRGVGNKMNIFVSHLGSMNGMEYWRLTGQDRSGGRGLTSLNISTQQNADNPRLAGGATTAGATELLPWVAWDEDSPVARKRQVFVARGVADAGSLGGLRWVPVGRITYPGETSLNLDTNQPAQKPDIAFSGQNSTVPWVVWTEADNARDARSFVFAARAVADASVAGGYRWERAGSCSTNETCALNRDVYRNASNPRIASGTLAGEDATQPKPWVAWQESNGRYKEIYVSRFDGTRWVAVGGALNIETFNDASDPDIFFVGHTPHVTWSEVRGGFLLVHVKRLADATPGRERWEMVSQTSGLNVEMFNLGTKPAIHGSISAPVVVWQENTRLFNQSLVFGVVGR